MCDGLGTSFASIGTLSKDEAVQELEFSDDRSWLQFRRLNGLTAWGALDQFRKLGIALKK